MKKFVAIILVILMMTTLCACGNSVDYSGTYEMDKDASHVASLFCNKAEDFVSCESTLTLSPVNDYGVGEITCRARVTAWDNKVKVNTNNIEDAYDNAMEAFDVAQSMLDGDFNYSEYMNALKEANSILDETIQYERVQETAENVIFYGTYTVNDDGNIVVTQNEDSILLYAVDEDEYTTFVINVADGILSFSFKDYGDIYEFVYK